MTRKYCLICWTGEQQQQQQQGGDGGWCGLGAEDDALSPEQREQHIRSLESELDLNLDRLEQSADLESRSRLAGRSNLHNPIRGTVLFSFPLFLLLLILIFASYSILLVFRMIRGSGGGVRGLDPRDV